MYAKYFSFIDKSEVYQGYIRGISPSRRCRRRRRHRCCHNILVSQSAFNFGERRVLTAKTNYGKSISHPFLFSDEQVENMLSPFNPRSSCVHVQIILNCWPDPRQNCGVRPRENVCQRCLSKNIYFVNNYAYLTSYGDGVVLTSSVSKFRTRLHRFHRKRSKLSRVLFVTSGPV